MELVDLFPDEMGKKTVNNCYRIEKVGAWLCKFLSIFIHWRGGGRQILRNGLVSILTDEYVDAL